MKKVIGIILLVMAALAILGSFVGGEASTSHNIFYYIGYYGAFAALIIGGIALIRSGSKK